MMAKELGVWKSGVLKLNSVKITPWFTVVWCNIGGAVIQLAELNRGMEVSDVFPEL